MHDKLIPPTIYLLLTFLIISRLKNLIDYVFFMDFGALCKVYYPVIVSNFHGFDQMEETINNCVFLKRSLSRYLPQIIVVLMSLTGTGTGSGSWRRKNWKWPWLSIYHHLRHKGCNQFWWNHNCIESGKKSCTIWMLLQADQNFNFFFSDLRVRYHRRRHTYYTRCQIWCTIEAHRDPISKVLSEW